MKRYSLAALSLLASLAVLAVDTAPVHAEARPVAVTGTTLQTYLTNKLESIVVAADQETDDGRWKSTVSGNSAMTLMIELASNPGGNSIGVYNAAEVAPTPFVIFPATATTGQYVMASFRSGPDRMIVTLFNEDGSINTLPITSIGVNIHDFGYYISRAGGDFGYSQDFRNTDNLARVLTFKGQDENAGNWWLCFEDGDPGEAGRDFDDAILFVESINPTPVSHTSWGALKSRFR